LWIKKIGWSIRFYAKLVAIICTSKIDKKIFLHDDSITSAYKYCENVLITQGNKVTLLYMIYFN